MHTATLPLISADTYSRPHTPASRVASVPAQRQFDSQTLFAGAQEIRIEHYGQEYRLRQTRNGKLILTK
jgi:hemin uptake protein HemP